MNQYPTYSPYRTRPTRRFRITPKALGVCEVEAVSHLSPLAAGAMAKWGLARSMGVVRLLQDKYERSAIVADGEIHDAMEADGTLSYMPTEAELVNDEDGLFLYRRACALDPHDSAFEEGSDSHASGWTNRLNLSSTRGKAVQELSNLGTLFKRKHESMEEVKYRSVHSPIPLVHMYAKDALVKGQLMVRAYATATVDCDPETACSWLLSCTDRTRVRRELDSGAVACVALETRSPHDYVKAFVKKLPSWSGFGLAKYRE